MPSLPYIGYARLISIIITYSTESASVLRGVAYISPFSAQIRRGGIFIPYKSIESLEELRAKRNAYMKAYRKRVESENPEKLEARRAYMRNYMRQQRLAPDWEATKEERRTYHAINLLSKRGYVITKDGKPVAPKGEGTAQ